MIRFVNGRVLRFAGEMRLTGDEVWTDGGEIAYVGPARADAPVFERTVNLNGDVLMPGFKNAHTHTAMTFLRSYADDMPLNDWLYKQVFPHEAKVTPEMLYVFTKLGILEYLSSGITASFDMYFHNDAYAQANIDSGFRTVICAALNNFDKDVENIEREYLKFNALDELVSYRLGIHAEYTTCRERMEYLCALAHKYKEPCFAHLCETKAEVDGCVERWGMTPPQLLDSIGFFDYGGGGFHCNALDFFREMYLASVLQKVKLSDAAAGGADRVLEMACVGGARVMGLEDCDDIAPGKRADLVVLDLNRPNMQPLHNIPRNIVYAGSRENVRLTMVNGRVLYENGEFFIGEDPKEIYAKANAMIREITA